MRTLRQNQQTLYYSEFIKEEPVYVLDENGDKIISYVDEEGNIYYEETGEHRLLYSQPKEMEVNIAFSGGEAQSVEFGVDVSNYDASIVYMPNEYPLTETSILWYQTKPQYFADGEVDGNSADFKVTKIKPSLNAMKVLLEQLVK